MEAEGWYLDPFGRHEQRWFSAGKPTALVRDGRQHGHDDPPTEEYAGPLTQADPPESDNSDLKRADDLTRNAPTIDKYDVIDAAIRVGLNPWDGPL